MVWSALGTKVLATLLVGFGLGPITSVAWTQIAFVWAYCIAWAFVEDQAKLAVYRILDHQAPHHQRFLTRLQEHLHPAA